MSKPLIEAINNLADALRTFANRGLTRSARTGYSDKVIYGKRDCIVSVQIGREFPGDISKQEYKTEVDKLMAQSEYLVDKWADATVEKLRARVHNKESGE